MYEVSHFSSMVVQTVSTPMLLPHLDLVLPLGKYLKYSIKDIKHLFEEHGVNFYLDKLLEYYKNMDNYGKS